jgi:hypothetical protein
MKKKNSEIEMEQRLEEIKNKKNSKTTKKYLGSIGRH